MAIAFLLGWIRSRGNEELRATYQRLQHANGGRETAASLNPTLNSRRPAELIRPAHVGCRALPFGAVAVPSGLRRGRLQGHGAWHGIPPLFQI